MTQEPRVYRTVVMPMFLSLPKEVRMTISVSNIGTSVGSLQLLLNMVSEGYC